MCSGPDNAQEVRTELPEVDLSKYRKHMRAMVRLQACLRAYRVRKKVHVFRNNKKGRSYADNAARGRLTEHPYEYEAQNPLNKPFSDEEIVDRPEYTFKNGAIYKGQWKGKIRHGFGKQVWPDGARYEGEWKSNKANGKGTFWHVDGDIYEGEWEDDKANGYGVYTHVNGARYEGYWKEDLQHGRGSETWADGSKYEGDYVLGKKEGSGKYTWSD